jgi:phosphonate transport system permease protein
MSSLKLANFTPPQSPFASRMLNWFLLMGFVVFLSLSFKGAGIVDIPRLWEKWDNTQIYLAEYLKPDFSDLFLPWEKQTYLPQMLVTLAVALWGTVLSIILAIPFALLSSSNIAPAWIVQPVRRLMDLLRSVNELVMATAFLVAVGIGPLTGVLALALHNTGVLAKLFSEAVEAVDTSPIEGVRATGARRLQEIIWGVIPQVAPLWTSFSLYRFESSVRSSTVLGLIGAGGIGFVLFENLKSFAYRETSAIAVVIIVAVSIIDFGSHLLRKRLM